MIGALITLGVVLAVIVLTPPESPIDAAQREYDRKKRRWR